jgi:hypothetical protein
MNTLLLLHAAATWALAGLMWTVQLVLYPLFAQVDAASFQAYHARHLLRITLTIGPLLAVEFLTLAVLLLADARNPWLLASLVPLAFSYFSTWAVQVPLHQRLALGFDAEVLRRLIASNRWRTAAWTLRGVCVLVAAAQAQP